MGRPANGNKRAYGVIKEHIGDNDIWVFGYGSLMWRPGFTYQEMRQARLQGYHRALCVYSHHYRGTPERPGLVLGLDRGGCCVGMAIRVAARDSEAVIDYLWQREMLNDVYLPKWLPVTTDKGKVDALCFVVRRDHEQYARGLSLEESARLVAQGYGDRG
ncbi:MAG: gamma-glutamylcyclotransferase, partial [Rhodobacterales bacterium]|nr:gamma-glutamylcyclotransferase [Rhodobacterales bacterium]